MSSADYRSRSQAVADDYSDQYYSFVKNSMPHVQNMIDSLNNPQIINHAVAANKRLDATSGAEMGRGLARVGRGMSPAQQQAMERMRSLGNSTTKSSNLNLGRRAQIDSNANTAYNLRNISSELMTQGQNDRMESIGLQGSRERRDEADSMARRSQRMSLAASAVTAALMHI